MPLNRLYTKKQRNIIKASREKDWFMMINHGAVRAGKTVLDNDLFLFELKRAKKNAEEDGVMTPMYILGSTSAGTLQTNIIREIEDKYAQDIKFDRYGNFTFWGVYVVTTFTGSIAGLKSIRGMTAYGAYINEATLANKEVFDEIVKRCSGLGARIILDTNPDHPNHWLKVDYIDKADGEKIVANHFTIFDNDFLNKRYVDNLIAVTPSGVFTERGIYGRWTSGEGAVYTDFDEKKHYVDELPEIKKYFCGVDWGYEHWGSIVVMGEDENGKTYLIEEHAAQHEEIDYWVKVAKDIQKRYGVHIPFYADSARPEHVARFVREGIRAQNANKSVLSGIEEVAKLFKQGRLFVLRSGVSKFNDEIYQYVWNKKTGEPVKENDDVLDAVRYAIYSRSIVKNRKMGTTDQKLRTAKRLFG
ncbi:PBSX family phage terminase large subunit [Jeotgalibaca porci]|uniref:PBSX family phage terminase large subunit n=1 Tax=Jeotgalibaca porci TaxID=1868793 RepID=A0A6G7WED8_9LACT|nr:PBSX family phage terminase large subunit [Jeotgalibaca porci]QIK50613.1 PBSX family phage terminase large subunit [Jeotgalibaca porci]